MEYIAFGELYAEPSSNGVSKPSGIRGEGIEMIGMGELFAHDIIDDMMMERVPMAEREMNKYIVYADDLLFARQSMVAEGAGKCSIVKALSRKTTFESHLIRVRLDKTRCNPWYYFYLFSLKNNPVKTIINQCAQAGIRAKELEKLKVPYFAKEKQDRIVSVLMLYDNLIENNQKRIKLLEQMAQRLYQEWFVRFRFPGYETTKFVDGIPQGWEIVPIGTQCDVVGGATPSTNVPSNWNGDIKWVTPTDITRNNALPLIDIEGRITMKGLKSCATKLLPPETILMTSRASIGYIGLTKESVCTNQGFISVLPNHPNMKMYFVYMLLSRRDELINYANGSTFLEISRSNFKKLKMLLPSENILHQFENITANIFDEEYALEQQNKNLIKQRDLLLPRLMSGKLAI